MVVTGKIIGLVLSLALGISAGGCAPGINEEGGTQMDTNNPTNRTADQEKRSEGNQSDIIVIEMEDGQQIKAELYPQIAPISVANFKKLIDQKFFDGLIFHRIISGFMIQGGGFGTDMKQKNADTIKGEFKSNGVTNDLKHTRGVLSMARVGGAPDSASSQFFIMHKDSPHLDGEYAAFGKVIEGMEVVDNIAETPVSGDAPINPPVIKTIRMSE